MKVKFASTSKEMSPISDTICLPPLPPLADGS